METCPSFVNNIFNPTCLTKHKGIHCELVERINQSASQSVSQGPLSSLSAICSGCTFSLDGYWMVPWKVRQDLTSPSKGPWNRSSFLRVSINRKVYCFVLRSSILTKTFQSCTRICSNHTKLFACQFVQTHVDHHPSSPFQSHLPPYSGSPFSHLL